jgi:nicotinamidase/pyrazinamidase
VVDYDRSTALVVVDVQNDFADPKGSLYVGEGERVVPLANREIERALGAGGLVAYTQDWHPAQTPHFQSGGGVWPQHPTTPKGPRERISGHGGGGQA